MSSVSPRMPRCGSGRTDTPSRYGAPQAVSFPALGAALHMNGMPGTWAMAVPDPEGGVTA
jgi:hypothetical protein